MAQYQFGDFTRALVAWTGAHKMFLAGLAGALSLYLAGRKTEALAALLGVLSGGVNGPPQITPASPTVPASDDH